MQTDSSVVSAKIAQSHILLKVIISRFLPYLSFRIKNIWSKSTMTAHKLRQHFVHFPNPFFLTIFHRLYIRTKTHRLSRWWCTQNFEPTNHKSHNRQVEHPFSHWFLLWAVHIPGIGTTGNHNIQLIYNALILAVSSHSLCASSHDITSSPYHIIQKYLTEFVNCIELWTVWLFASIMYSCLPQLSRWSSLGILYSSLFWLDVFSCSYLMCAAVKAVWNNSIFTLYFPNIYCLYMVCRVTSIILSNECHKWSGDVPRIRSF